MYVKAAVILLLLSGLIAGIWKFGDYCGDARENKIRLEFAAEREALAMRIKELDAKNLEERNKREVIYRDKIKTVYQIRDNCLDTAMPPELLQTFCDIGLAGKELCESSVTR